MKYLNEIVTGNCVDIMSELPTGSIDLTVTSPPYDQLRDYKGYDFNFEAIAAELYRVTKEGGVVVWVVGDQVINGSESGTSFRQALAFMGLGFRLHDTMIYEKASPSAPDKNRYFQVFEYMFIFSKGRPIVTNLIEDRKNIWDRSFGNRSIRLKDGTLKNKGKHIKSKSHGVRFNIWRYANGKGFTTKDAYAFNHPAIFPEKLAQDHIVSWSNPGDIVLDPMCGSGTTCKMAKINARDFIGIDISNEYAEIGRRRVQVQSMHPAFLEYK